MKKYKHWLLVAGIKVALAVPLLSSARPALAQVAEEKAVTTLRLRVGEQTVLSAQGVQSFSEGVRGIVDVRLTPNATEFVIVAMNPGFTSLLLLMQNGERRQFSIEVEPKAEQMAVAGKQSVGARDNVRLDFYFVQLDKGENGQFGVDWPGSFGGGQANIQYDFLTSRFETAAAVVTQALPKLDMAQSRGFAKLTRHVAVITANGEKAAFSGGGEVNIPIQGNLSTGIHQISFGSQLEIEPRYDSQSGRLDLRVRAKVSDLSDDRGSGAPGRVTSELDTLVNLELGQSLILAGLSAKSEAESRSGLTGLSQLPLLGMFFGTERAQRQSSENIVVIVPSVIDAAKEGAERRLKEALDRFQKYRGEKLDESLFSKGEGHGRR